MKEKNNRTSINRDAELNEKLSSMMHVICEDCGKTFVLMSDEICHKEKFTAVKDTEIYDIYLTYYDCPYCGRRHFVQIDDDKSLSMLRQQKDLFIKLYKRKIKNESPNKKDKNKFEKLQKDISSYRLHLMEMFNNAVITNKDKNEICALRFSI